jgi:hypothetical protein
MACSPPHFRAWGNMDRIRCAIIGVGLGAGFGIIGVAFMATAALRVHRPERLFDEVLMIVMGSLTGLTLGWLSGAPVRNLQRVNGSRHATVTYRGYQ